MPCILKQKTKDSPGIITFSHGEALYGVPAKSARMREWLRTSAKNKEWIFGVHVQGDCSNLGSWPLTDWQSFIMWPDTKAAFLKNVPEEKLLPINCIHFIKDIEPQTNPTRKWDITIVSRASKIKRIYETVLMVKKIMVARPETKVLFIVPDDRDISKGEKTYVQDDIDRRFFDLPLKLFTSKELQNICFLSPSTKSFGIYPISYDIVIDSMRHSKFMMLTSHREGVPRVITESLMANTPVIVSKNLRGGNLDVLTTDNTLFLEDDIDIDVTKILYALDNYSSFKIDQSGLEKFKAKNNTENLKKILSEKIKALGRPVEGEWYLENLLMRLPGHGVKHSFQFMNDVDSFFHWLKQVDQGNPYDEDLTWRDEKIKIDILALIQRKFILLKHVVKSQIKKMIS